MEHENKLIEGEDFYFEKGLMVFTEKYHLKRGYCCQNKCRHCPYSNYSSNSNDSNNSNNLNLNNSNNLNNSDNSSDSNNLNSSFPN